MKICIFTLFLTIQPSHSGAAQFTIRILLGCFPCIFNKYRDTSTETTVNSPLNRSEFVRLKDELDLEIDSLYEQKNILLNIRGSLNCGGWKSNTLQTKEST